jgi:type I restriction enzyme M protein
MAKFPTKKTPKKSQVGFEEALWDSANKLRGSVESSEYQNQATTEVVSPSHRRA